MGLILIIIVILFASFMGYDAACYRLVRLIKGPISRVKYFGQIPGYSIYYYHKYIKKMEKEQDETKKDGT